MRQDPGAGWMKFRAKQTIAVESCDFEWRASTGPAGLIHVRDALAHNQGDLKVSALGIVPIAHLHGSAEVTRGELLRYLAELAFVPDAIAFNPNLRWRVFSPRAFCVSAGEVGLATSIKLTLDDQGRIGEVYTDARPRAVANSFTPTPWRGRFSDYRMHAGRWLPFAGEVAWVIEGREFVYWQGCIETWRIEARP